MKGRSWSLEELAGANPRKFIDTAYQAILDRPPTATEHEQMLAAMMRGDARTWLLGTLRYGAEGRAHGASIAGLRRRYLAQRMFRLAAIGPLLEWINAAASLPKALRYFRAELARADVEARSRLDAIHPPPLGDTLETAGSSLTSLARERSGISAETRLASLTAHARYALFESVFYESPAVAAKQRVYIPYVDRELARQLPFLDLGCGRGEFMRILREAGIESVGVDINPTGLRALRADAFTVVEQDILEFLEADRRTYSGASVLQVVEHLTHDRIERMLALVAARLAPRAVLIVETPNPLSPFALGVFHTDPTHVSPLPPERLRYSIEAAGFEHARTLFQARIPKDQFAGPDPRAYYADYAIIAERSLT